MSSSGWCHATPEGFRVAVQVTPNAKRTEVIGTLEGALRIRLQAQPVEGRANEELIRLIAKLAGQPKSAVQVMRGHTGRRKVVQISAPGLDMQTVMERLLGEGGG